MTDLGKAPPGEAEVVGWAYRGPRGGLIVTEEKPEHAPEAVPLVTLASLQAMQARAEAAYNEGYSARDEVVAACRARVKELEEALAFYGDVSKYPAPLTGGMGALWADCGEIARKALAQNVGNKNGA